MFNLVQTFKQQMCSDKKRRLAVGYGSQERCAHRSIKSRQAETNTRDAIAGPSPSAGPPRGIRWGAAGGRQMAVHKLGYRAPLCATI
jgi:hypothetical protein